MINNNISISESLLQKLNKMPKIELHIHVEGATEAETFFTLAKKNNVKLPANSLEEWKSYFKFKDFNHFIDVYILAVSALQKSEDYTFLIEEFYKHQSKENIIYSEAFLSASFLVQNFNDSEILDAIALGMKNGQKKYNVIVNFIPDIARNIPKSEHRVLELVIKGKERGLFIGLGLGGMENGYPAKLFKNTYKKAIKNGLHVVAHAGEVVGSESIWSAINDLKAERIGHGITCLNDKNIVDYLRENKIPIEVSPTSNYCLGVVKNGDNHPIRKMIDKGLFCTLNSDDPAMFSTTLTQEYELLINQGFSFDQLWQLNMNAIEASFLSNNDKELLKKQCHDFLIS